MEKSERRWRMQYGTGAIAVPELTAETLMRASAADLRVLMMLCTDRALLSDTASAREALAEALSCEVSEVERSLGFWRGVGVLNLPEESGQKTAKTAVQAEVSVPEAAVVTPAAAAADSAAEKGTGTPMVRVVGPMRAEALPNYTTAELTELLERRQEAAALIDETQRIIGKVFNTREVNIIVGLMDYLSLDSAYIVLLCSYCKKIGKTSLSYVERTAFGLCREGIDDATLLQERLRRMEHVHDAEEQVRRIFGMGERKLTPNEHKWVTHWVDEMGFDMPMVERAYQITVENTGKASMKYAGGVLERWYGDGIRTLEEVDAAEEAWQESKAQAQASAGSGKTPGGRGKTDAAQNRGSFDTDDFFEAALRRSYDDM